MTRRASLLVSIATTIADYRAGEIAPLTSEHVDKWVHQFTESVQIPLLSELDHVLKKTYFSRDFVKEFLDNLLLNNSLAGVKPCEFWKRASLLEIQQNGQSQSDMLDLFKESLRECCNIVNSRATSSDQYIYLDDALFSGSRIGNDLEAWISTDAPRKAEVHIICIATHKLGEWQCQSGLSRTHRIAAKISDSDSGE
jgi:hypothetical protein